jgi:hypothetical protein
METKKNFASIEQFRTFLKELIQHDESRNIFDATYTLRGTVKLHGTHADIVARRTLSEDLVDPCFTLQYQSRNRILTPEQDNCGFARHMRSVPVENMSALMKNIKDMYHSLKGEEKEEEEIEEIMIAGEWCGRGIQKGVAISELPPMFVIFAIKVNDVWQDIVPFGHIQDTFHQIYNITRGPVYELTLRTKDPGETVNALVALTAEIEKECPFGKTFGVSGIGEGAVFVCKELLSHSKFWFKVKGDLHSVSRVKTLKEKSSEEKEMLKNVDEFAKRVVTEARLEQAESYLREMNLDWNIRNMGTFISFVVKDVLKEEKEEMQEYGIQESVLKKKVSGIAKRYFLTGLSREPAVPSSC